MSRLRLNFSMSLDGFVAGPSQSVDDPLGIGGMRLHQWVFPLAVWRAVHGLQGGEVSESTQVVEESLLNIGASVIGTQHVWRSPWLLGCPETMEYLAAGLVDEMSIHVVPTLLGGGERLFDGIGDDLHGLEHVRTIGTPAVTHLKFAR